MKNKTSTYLLMLGAIVVWGLIFYRIFSAVDSGDDSSLKIEKKEIINSSQKEEEKIVVLIAHYRDPFLGTINSVANDDGVFSRSKVLQKKKKETIDWSFIHYIGLVHNKKTQKKTGLVSLSGKDYIISNNDIVEGVKILKAEKDSVWVEYLWKKKWIVR